MPKKLKLVETGEKSEVVTFRIGRTLYEALEKRAQMTGGTVSATARSLLLASLENEPMTYRAGDRLQDCSSSTAVFIVGDRFTEDELMKRLKTFGDFTFTGGFPDEK